MADMYQVGQDVAQLRAEIFELREKIGEARRELDDQHTDFVVGLEQSGFIRWDKDKECYLPGPLFAGWIPVKPDATETSADA